MPTEAKLEVNHLVSWTANKRSGALKHKARGKIIEIDLEKHQARIEMKVGPGGSMKNRFWKNIEELTIENG
jgi:hypothetical protein